MGVHFIGMTFLLLKKKSLSAEYLKKETMLMDKAKQPHNLEGGSMISLSFILSINTLAIMKYAYGLFIVFLYNL
jgi:hypothetical protein